MCAKSKLVQIVIVCVIGILCCSALVTTMMMIIGKHIQVRKKTSDLSHDKKGWNTYEHLFLVEKLPFLSNLGFYTIKRQDFTNDKYYMFLKYLMVFTGMSRKNSWN